MQGAPDRGRIIAFIKETFTFSLNKNINKTIYKHIYKTNKYINIYEINM